MMRFNKLILLFLVFWISPGWADEPVIFCDASKGLELLNKDFYSADQITMILNACDKVSPDSSSVLLLHGLFARKEAQQSKHYEMAIYWLTKATMAALPHDYSAALELAATYEWANNPTKAGEIYQSILTQNPHNRAALLGQARIFRLEAQPTQAAFIYQNLLSKNQNDPDALNGMGWIKAGAKDLKSASDYFHQTLAIEPENQEATLPQSHERTYAD